MDADAMPTWRPTNERLGNWRSGLVRRAQWPAGTPGAPPADAIPGGRVDTGAGGDAVVSGIVVVVYDRMARAATAREAARVLVSEQTHSDEASAVLEADPELRMMVRGLDTSIACARALLERGYGGELKALVQFRLLDAADAADLDADLLRRWNPRSWSGWLQPGNFTPAEARRLLAAGIDGARAEQLHAIGYRGPDEVLAAARPPQIPDTATRIVLHTGEWGKDVHVTSDPAAARAWLADHPLSWRPDLVEVDLGPGPIDVSKDWSVWDDGRYVSHAKWLPAGPDSEPAALSQAAFLAVNMCAQALDHGAALGSRVWLALRDTVEASTEVTHRHAGSGTDENGGRWHLSHGLTKYTFTLADGSHLVLWRLDRSSRYAGIDISGIGSSYTMFADEARALGVFEAGKREASE
jgi:hypothetical protein